MSSYLFVKSLLLPPASLVLAGLAGLVLARRWRRTGRAVAWGSVAVGVLLCVPYVATGLLGTLQRAPAIDPGATAIDADVVVVVLADLDADPFEWGIDQPGPLSLERLRYGAELARRTGLPLLLSGGVVRPDREALADRFAPFVEEELDVPVRWRENRSHTTRDNARYTAALLAEEAPGRRRVALVTHAWHVPRARAAFERAGLEVLPAPLAAVHPPSRLAEGLVPRASSLFESYLALHEWLGIAWYALRDR